MVCGQNEPSCGLLECGCNKGNFALSQSERLPKKLKQVFQTWYKTGFGLKEFVTVLQMELQLLKMLVKIMICIMFAEPSKVVKEI